MIVEPLDALMAMQDGSQSRPIIADKLKRVRDTLGDIANEDLVVWVPDWFFEAYESLLNSSRAYRGQEVLPETIIFGVKMMPNSQHPEWGGADDDRPRHFHVTPREGWEKAP